MTEQEQQALEQAIERISETITALTAERTELSYQLARERQGHLDAAPASW